LESTKTISGVGGNEDEDTQYFKSEYETQDDLKTADMKIAEQLTEEGAVLLKNENNALPLSNTAKVTILGHSSTNMLVCGTGSADIDATDAPTLKEAIEARTKLSVNTTVWNYYQKLTDNEEYLTNPKKGDNSIRTGDGGVAGKYTVNEVPWSTLTAQSGVNDSFKNYKDAAIVVVSRLGGEMYDLPADTAHKGNDEESSTGNALELSYNEIELIKKANETFDKVIVLINSANAVECDFLTDPNNEYGVDAALWIGYTGLVGLYGTADLLVGNENPSGRLVDTYCNDNTTAPALVNFYANQWTNASAWGKDMVGSTTGGDLDGNQFYNVYQEGIYVGYRYYETRYEDYVLGRANTGEYSYTKDVAYPFGYGLSYTNFTYSDITYEDKGTSIEVSLLVTNSGAVAGKDVVEVYFQSEYTAYDIANGIEKAAVELCGFAKTSLLEEGKSEKVTITIDKQEFRTYDAKTAKTYIMDAGDYYLTIGKNAHDALNNILAKKNGDAKKMVAVNGDETAGNASLVYTWNVDKIDSTTYSVSYENSEDGYAITNQFDTASLSYYGGTDIKYLSRNDWTGSWPTAKVALELTQKMHDEMTGIKDYEPEDTEEEMPTMGADNGLTLVRMRGKAYDDADWDKLLDQVTYSEMCRLIGLGYHATVALESVSKPATKDENGPQGFSGKLTDVFGNSLTICAYTDENIMAATWNVDLMQEVGEHIGEDGLWCGYAGLYGPAMNTHRTAYSGRNFEYYSEDGFLGGKIAAAEVTGIQSKGVYVYIKHFALNDEETSCRSISTFANEQSIRELYLQPFEHAVVEGGAHNVMNSFARVGVVWSGAHKGLMTNVLRYEWGMDGFAISDYTSTSYATTAHKRGTYDALLGVVAGTDTFDSGSEEAQAKFLLRYDYKNDPYLVNCMRQATHRILYTVVNSHAMNGIGTGDRIVEVPNWWQFAIIDGIMDSSVAFVVFTLIAIVKTKRYIKRNSPVTPSPEDILLGKDANGKKEVTKNED
jgi:beta-glucosidase